MSENPGHGGPRGWAALLLVGVFIASMKISAEERLLGEVFCA